MMRQNPAWFAQFDGLQQFLMRKSKPVWQHAAAILRRNDTEEEITTFDCGQSTIQRSLMRIHCDRAFM
jgi:hypothetical protein